MILIGFGSNLPFCGADSAQILRLAGQALAEIVDFRQCSAIYSSPAWPDAADPPYANAVCEISTGLGPEDLLQLLDRVERAFGRRRSECVPRNASRTLDLDLLAYNDEIIETSGLTVPHPRLADRRFVLAPLAEIAPDWRHPATGAPLSGLIASAAGRADFLERWVPPE